MNVAPLPGVVHPAGLALLAFVPPLLLWIGLASRQAWRSDPLRHRRRGQRELQRLTRRCAARNPSRLELETWRELCVQAWGLAQSVPDAATLAAAVPAEADPAAWAQLWQEAERALYSAHGSLPRDWPERARRRAAALPPFPAMPWLPAQRPHWLPALQSTWVAVLLVAVPLSNLHAAGDPSDRTTWLGQIARQPGDWEAHRQLAQSYRHDEQWGPAAGHGTAAFLLNPHSPTVVSDFAAGLAKLEGVEPRLSRLAARRGWDGLAARFSPAQWQTGLDWAAAGFALSGCALVLSRYLRFRRACLGIGLGWLCCAGITLAAATAALRLYGPLASPRAALVIRRAEVRSIPSDLVAKESAATLPAGAVVTVIRSFFGWDQVVLDDGAVGWARTESLLWLYRHRDDSTPAKELP